MTDIVFAEELQNSQGDLINYSKFAAIAGIIKTLRQYQATPFSFGHDQQCQTFLSSTYILIICSIPNELIRLALKDVVLDDDQLYDLSHFISPREGKDRPPRPIMLNKLNQDVRPGSRTSTRSYLLTKIAPVHNRSNLL